MTILTSAQREQLLANGRAQAACIADDGNTIDFQPVLKLFTPDANATWLLTELDTEDVAFGLCDVGLGESELGYVSLAELEGVRGRLGLPIECDASFTANHPLSQYAVIARERRRIVTS
jgi:Protein of unknown function (DUF2958)